MRYTVSVLSEVGNLTVEADDSDQAERRAIKMFSADEYTHMITKSSSGGMTITTKRVRDPYKVQIRWGKDPEYWQFRSYEFKTKAELTAFRLGLDEALPELEATEVPEYFDPEDFEE